MYRLFFVLRVTAFLLVSLIYYTPLFAQAPVIKYTTPRTYKINTPITPLVPVNTGSAVPATIYGQVSTIAGSATVSIFHTVTGVAVDEAGNVFIADWGDNKIYKLTPTGNLSLFAGGGNSGWDDGQGTTALFYEPDALISDAAGNIYVSDQANNLIRKITPGGFVTTLAGTAHTPGLVDGTGLAAQFNGPRGLAIDNAGNLYVADQANNVIRKVTAAGVVTTYAGNGTMGAQNGDVHSASFSTPTAVALDGAGNLYVSDVGNNAIRKISPGGVVSTFATGFRFPRELRVDGTGNVYVTEQEGNTIKRISPAGVVTIIAGGGATDAGGARASFYGPLGMAIDGKGNLYIGESGNNDVRKIVITGYTINKSLPAGMVFDPKTGAISGTPTVLSPPTVYTITAYNAKGSNPTTVNIQVVEDIVLQPSVITFPPPVVVHIDADNILHPGATSTNTETPITYTSSNPDVAYVGADGQIHVIAPGVTNITAYQTGNDTYSPAVPVQRPFTITQDQVISFPAIAAKSTCSTDFPAGATSSNSTIPLTYVSSDPAVATVSATGVIHIIGAGVTTITASQSGNSLYNAAIPKSQILTVAAPVVPSVTIDPAGVIAGCDGMEYEFTADAQNAGSNATYQWRLNGQNVGGNSNTYKSTLHTGDIITCVVINNDGCAPVASPVSNTSTIVADPYVTLTLTISSSVSGTVIAGTPVTFKAQPVNVQGTPDYQWYVNGQPVGTNSATFTSNTLADGDGITCIMSSGGKCIANPVVTSNTIVVSVVVPEKIVVPNTFTPNGDGYNDTWFIPGLLSYTNCTINIYNRYGAMMYRSVGYQHPWDGTSNGKAVPTGAYYYVIDTKSSSGKLSGEVTVLR